MRNFVEVHFIYIFFLHCLDRLSGGEDTTAFGEGVG